MLRGALIGLRGRWTRICDFVQSSPLVGPAIRHAKRPLIALDWRLSAAGVDDGAVPRGAVRQEGAARLRRMIVDVGAAHERDMTGVQRVVLSLASALQETVPPGWDIRFTSDIADLQTGAGFAANADAPGGRPAAFLALDLAIDGLVAQRHALRRFRETGGTVGVLLFDLLPLAHPEWFRLGFAHRFAKWARTVDVSADRIFCISQAVAADATRLLRHHPPETRVRTLALSEVRDPIGKQAEIGMAAVPAGPSCLLAVGTIEPRKGHADLLAACSLLWKDGAQFMLVLVGRPGWMTACIQRQIAAHPEFERRLFWFTSVEDDELAAFIRRCAGVIAPSYAEGLGLTIGEALSFGKPVLARDIPAFREQARPGIAFFPEKASRSVLAQAIDSFLQQVGSETVPEVQDAGLGWRDIARQLWEAMHAAEFST
jgi:glycosyltransferase involved in cell wall biosynthesis